MKKWFAGIAAFAVLVCGGCQGTGSSSQAGGNAEAADDGFRMMIRLWPMHHDDPALTDQLIKALGKYDFCDEIWLCSNDPMSHAISWHEPHAKAAGVAAGKFRDAGIIPSMQAVFLGHGDGTIVGSYNGPVKDSTIHWGTMVGPDGSVCMTVNCPRQPEYLAYMEKAVMPYAEAAQPYSLYIDDDLRITQHPPASSGCFCDLCIGLFNKEYGHSFSRASLVEALKSNADGGTVRREWIAFSQESLAGIARAVARGVHKVSPRTRMGLQHANFHHKLLEGWDWNPIFKAMEEETGLTPVSRPGHGFYADHEPRGMIQKGLGIARQIRRLDPGITEIAPEIEGYEHKATGKSPKSICVETMYYLSMGATQMSYAIICAANEPLSWYADNYFKALSEWKPFAKEYAAFNKGTHPAGIDPYISPSLVCRDVEPGEGPWAWSVTKAGDQAFPLVALGFPFAPEAEKPIVRMIDEELVRGLGDEELSSLLNAGGVVADRNSWKRLVDRKLVGRFQSVEAPEREVAGDLEDASVYGNGKYSIALSHILFYEKDGARIAVVPSFSDDVNGASRLAMLHAFDWASGDRLPAVLESFAQSAVIPRSDSEGRLKSVAIMNCSISDQDGYLLRVRTGDPDNARAYEFIWKKRGQKDVRLEPRYDGGDVLLDIPMLEGWDFGWIAVQPSRK